MLEYCDNIAAILFGSVEYNELDKVYVNNLQKKYIAIRHQVIQYSLSKKFGDSWYRFAQHTVIKTITLMIAMIKMIMKICKI